MKRGRKLHVRDPAAARFSRERRLRVLPLAIGAVLATCASMAVASDLLHDVTKKPGVDIIKDTVADLSRAATDAGG